MAFPLPWFCSVILLHGVLQAEAASLPNETMVDAISPVERTRTMALFLSFIQCFPNTSTNLDADSIRLLQTHYQYDPKQNLNEYANLTEIKTLIQLVHNYTVNKTPLNLPFTNEPQSIQEMQQILVVLYRNAPNWKLFYNTVAWVLGRVNLGRLLWSLIVVSAEKFTNSVVFPSIPEVIPQLYIPKEWILPVAGLPVEKYISENPLYYWMTDPGYNEFHVHFHNDQPYWWNNDYYGVVRPRRGELFLYMHHQVMSRYNSERFSHGLDPVDPLDLYPDYRIPDGYHGDVVNFDYAEFQSRPDGWKVGAFDIENKITLSGVRQMYERVSEGIEAGYFIASNGSRVSILGENGTELVGNTEEASDPYSVNRQNYGSFHNILHQYLSGILRKKRTIPPGVQAHQETAMRDRLFYQIHKRVDVLYLDYKRKNAKPYTKADLEFRDVSILGLRIVPQQPKTSQLCNSTIFSNFANVWPYYWSNSTTPTLTTFMRTQTYNINNAARSCRSINDPPTIAQVKAIDYEPFKYSITLVSNRPEVAYGMIRIFLWPDSFPNGTKLKGDAAHELAIELDRFSVRLLPKRLTLVMRSSQNSSFTKLEPSIGLKDAYNISESSEYFKNPVLRRACGFPNNMLLPRGTPQGMSFTLTVFVSDETDGGYVDEKKFPKFPICGTLNGLQFPDKRAMGYPFDRPGTRFYQSTQGSLAPQMLSNVKQISVKIKHKESY